ncbi:MAG: 4-hydroxythreonine-4-phosphate dehydrogenase PdxA [Deferrisomatales bacterium]
MISDRRVVSDRSSAPCRPVRIALTCGEPAGIGPEVVWKALGSPQELEPGVEPVLVGPRSVWAGAARLVGGAPGSVPWPVVEPGGGEAEDWDWGRPTEASARVAARAVEAATRLALEGRVEALVTAPLTKEGLHRAGRPYPGHTEWLEALCGGGARATMMLAGESLRVVLVTAHLPLAAVPGAVTGDRVLAALRAAHRGLVGDLGIPSPRIGVAALNPHAGEGGLLGTEEREAILPAVEAARREGIDARGPVPADALFFQAATGAYDVVVAMYHDQGLGPLKLLHFHDGVNVTLGLPLVRTSPDHGTAYDIAGRGVAREDSCRQAVRWAARIARRRRQGPSEASCGTGR